jgi:hypothetical protein
MSAAWTQSLLKKVGFISLVVLGASTVRALAEGEVVCRIVGQPPMETTVCQIEGKKPVPGTRPDQAEPPTVVLTTKSLDAFERTIAKLPGTRPDQAEPPTVALTTKSLDAFERAITKLPGTRPDQLDIGGLSINGAARPNRSIQPPTGTLLDRLEPLRIPGSRPIPGIR